MFFRLVYIRGTEDEISIIRFPPSVHSLDEALRYTHIHTCAYTNLSFYIVDRTVFSYSSRKSAVCPSLFTER